MYDLRMYDLLGDLRDLVIGYEWIGVFATCYTR